MQNREGSASGQSGNEIAKPQMSAVAGRSEPKIIWLFSFLAAIHVLFFSAAFPFFNNVDEPIHFDLVLRYSQGRLPHQVEPILPDSVTYVAYYNSSAYYATPDEFPGGQYPLPPWTESPEKKRQDFEANCARWQSLVNYEVSQTPLYYTLAGLWWHGGQWLGLHSGRLLYWLRFFNVVQVVALVWLASLAARMIFPENRFVRIAVPALVAFMPQTAFYSIGNDTLPAVCFGITFICLLKWLCSEKPSAWLGAVSGIAFGATYLSKTTNLPLLVVAAAALLIKTGQFFRQGKLSTTFPALAAFLTCSAPPILGWMIWCQSNFGDLTGTKLKMEHFGWTVKPLGEWWHHPIFTPGGFWTYLSGQMSTFWQGEFQWHSQPLVLPGSSVVYTVLTIILLAAVLPAVFPQSSSVTSVQRRALELGLICFVAALGFFALLSIRYDFHDCPYPSRQYPYFTSGRLLLGALIPFLLLIAYGLDRVVSRFGNVAKWVTLGVMIFTMLVVEMATDWPVFSDPYNWFHLP
jgi:hypothetical protein